MPILSVRHVTTYRYAQPVAFGEHRLMMRPRADDDLAVLDERLEIFPPPETLSSAPDAHGNTVTVVTFAERSAELRFESRITVEHLPDDSAALLADDDAAFLPVAYDPAAALELAPFMRRRHADPFGALDRWVEQFMGGRASVGVRGVLAAIAFGIQSGFRYERRMAKGVQAPAETLRRGGGSCRDFAVLMIEAARSLGLAARFVSGYLHTPAASHEYVGGGATHAWAQVFVPGAGWIDYDPTNGIIGNRDLIRVAVADDPEAAAPLCGTFTGFASDSLGMSVEVSVEMIEESKAGAMNATLAGAFVPA
jgi:transglutaminase-like putative cysteine protease